MTKQIGCNRTLQLLASFYLCTYISGMALYVYIAMEESGVIFVLRVFLTLK